MDYPIQLVVIAPVLTDFRHCTHCEYIFDQTQVGQETHKQILNEYPEDFKEDFIRLSAWLSELAHRYRNFLQIKLVDSQSFEGFIKSVKYWVRRYPAFIISGTEKHVGWDKVSLDQALQKYIERWRDSSQLKD